MISTIDHLINSQINARKNSLADFYQNCFDHAKNLYSKDLKAHFNSVNVVEISNRESEHMVSAGDDCRVLMWSINNDVLSKKSEPRCLRHQHDAPIFTLAWDNENRRIFSGGYDRQVLIHDVETKNCLGFILHQSAVFCMSVSPERSEIFATALENGIVRLFDLRISNTHSVVLSDTDTTYRFHGQTYQSCCFNPINASYIAISNLETGIQLIDLRVQNKTLIKYEPSNENNDTGLTGSTLSAKRDIVTSIKFNKMGNQLLALRLYQAPTMYNPMSPKPILHFDQENYKNSCSFKSCCFAGDRDQYVCSGSDDFYVYIWKILADSPHKSNPIHLKLKGHRSIVNHVRYNPKFHILLTTGVEKIIKAWTPYRLENSIGGTSGSQEEYPPRRKFEVWYPSYSYNSRLFQSTDEDIGTLALVDSILKMNNSWTDDDNDTICKNVNSNIDENSSARDDKNSILSFVTDENNNSTTLYENCNNINNGLESEEIQVSNNREEVSGVDAIKIKVISTNNTTKVNENMLQGVIESNRKNNADEKQARKSSSSCDVIEVAAKKSKSLSKNVCSPFKSDDNPKYGNNAEDKND